MSTHFFHSGMVGAPTNTNAAGSTLAIIDACLNTGFNVAAPLSASVASEVMTLAYSAAHGYEDKVWIRLDGAPGGSITQRATVTSTTVLTIPAPGFADGPVSGSLSTRVAPADWEKVFVGTGKAVFRSKVEGPGSTRFFYRVGDDAAGLEVPMLRGFESMTDVDAGIGPFPTVAQVSGHGLRVQRGSSAIGNPWCVVADDRTCYVFLCRDVLSNTIGFGFGDFLPYGSADFFNAFAIGGAFQTLSFSSATTHYSPRGAAGTGAAITNNKIMLFGSSGGQTYPSSIDGGTAISRPVLVAQTNEPRGEWRGLMCCSHSPVPSSQHFLVVDNVAGVSGRALFVKEIYTSTNRCAVFPIDEDWA